MIEEESSGENNRINLNRLRKLKLSTFEQKSM